MHQNRMFYCDNLRLLVIMLVVALHVAITYSGLGGWYYKENPPLGPASLLFFALFQCFLQAFFMGALFMVAGYFAAAALQAKGAPRFLKGRAVRLGIPTLFYMLIINPLTAYYLMDWDHTRFPMPFAEFYAGYVVTFRFLGGTGPMWFALALLIFCALYAVVFALAGPGTAPGTTQGAEPGRAAAPRGPLTAPTVVGLAVAVSLGAFAIRIVQPIGTSILNMQLCYFAQYVALFAFGIAAHGRGWLETLDYRLCRRLLAVALLGIAPLAAIFCLGGGLAGNSAPWLGGAHWQSLVFSIWESFTGVFMSVGLAGVFRRIWNSQGPLTASLSASAFAVYMFHAPVVVLLARVLRPLEMAPVPKFLLVYAVALPVSFGVARAIRAVPVLRGMVRS